MYSCPLNVLHNTRNQNVLTVADSIHFNLFSYNILIYQNRMILGNHINNTNKLINIMVIDADLHTLSAQHIGGTHQNRISQLIRCLLGLFCSKYRLSCRSRNLALLQNLIKQFSVLCRIYILCRCSQNRHAHFHQRFCQLNGCLTSKLNNSAIRLLNINDALHILCCQRLKI